MYTHQFLYAEYLNNIVVFQCERVPMGAARSPVLSQGCLLPVLSSSKKTFYPLNQQREWEGQVPIWKGKLQSSIDLVSVPHIWIQNSIFDIAVLLLKTVHWFNDVYLLTQNTIPGFPHQADHSLTIVWHHTNNTKFHT